MTNIFDLAPTPSDAIQAMLTGLNKAEKQAGFTPNMNTWAAYDPQTKTCFGCAAFCTLAHLTHSGFIFDDTPTSEERAALFFPKDSDNPDTIHQFNRFETAIDLLRQGSLHSLFAFYDIPSEAADDAIKAVEEDSSQILFSGSKAQNPEKWEASIKAADRVRGALRKMGL